MAQRRGPWSQQEDACLMQLVQDQGPLNWVRIAQTLGTRTPKQCRERFHQNLKPTLNHEPITPEEGVQIELMVNDIGKRWAEIARRLNGRSDNAVKNWWNGNQNRRKRHDRRRANHSIHAHGFDDARYSSMTPYSQRACLSGPSHANNPYARHQQALSPTSPAFSTHAYASYHADSSLPSPSSTNSPRSEALDADPSNMSDSGSSYTTSQQAHTTSPIMLPPLRNITTDLQPRSLPGVGSLLNPSDSNESRIGTILLPPPHAQLPTAPSSPMDLTPSSRAQYGHSWEKDNRMAIDKMVHL